jgi:hypothetical protein
MASEGTSFWRVFVSLANQARQIASRTLRISLRSSALDAKLDPKRDQPDERY